MSSVLSLTRPGGWPEDSSPRSVLFNIIHTAAAVQTGKNWVIISLG